MDHLCHKLEFDVGVGPQPRQGGRDGQHCFSCNEYGHRKSECSTERILKCRSCDEIGHMSPFQMEVFNQASGRLTLSNSTSGTFCSHVGFWRAAQLDVAAV
jgi:hypothetical protein